MGEAARFRLPWSKVTRINDLDTPCLLVDLDIVKSNTSRMRQTCDELSLQLRAHTKTHKTLEGAVLQTGGTKRCIVVSTLAEAEFYASNGFDDILLAHPITPSKIPRCMKLMERLGQFHVFVSGPDGLRALENKASNQLPEGKVWSVVLEVDLGYGRTGFPHTDILRAADKVVKSSNMRLEAVYCHCGDMYAAKTADEREKLQGHNLGLLQGLKNKFNSVGINCKFGTGSTPTCSQPIRENKELSEFHPGAYVFYDYEQYLLGACTESDIACRVMTRVIAHKPELHMILVDCGFTAISHDGMRQRLPDKDFCLIQGHSNLKLIGMSQEIGKIVAKEGDLDCSKYPIGTIFYIFPYHCCAAAANHSVYHVHSGYVVVDKWIPVKGW